MSNIEISKMFKAFSDERRIDIIQILASGEKCACMLLEELDISQPTLSHHMKILCDVGIVSWRKEGKWTHYQLCEEGSQKVIEILHQLLDCKNHCCDQ